MKLQVKLSSARAIAGFVLAMFAGNMAAEDLVFDPLLIESKEDSASNDSPAIDDKLKVATSEPLLLQQPQVAGPIIQNAGSSGSKLQPIQLVAFQFPDDVAQRRTTIGQTLRALGGDDEAAIALAETPIKPYDFTLLVAGEYDSNVRLRPELSGLGPTVDRQDYRILLASFLDYQVIATDAWNVGFLGSTYNTFQFDASDFDLQNYMGGGYVNRRLHSDWIGAVRYEFHHTLLDQRRLASDHRLQPSLSRLSSGGHTTVYYQYNPLDSRAIALLAAQNQTGQTHRVGFSQAIYTFGGSGSVYFDYQFADTAADGSDFDRTAHRPGIRCEQGFSWGCSADLDVRYAWDDYDHPNSLDLLGRPRRDRRIEVRAGLQKNFSRPVSLRLDYTFINNDSNTQDAVGVRLFDYDRHILSTQLIFSL